MSQENLEIVKAFMTDFEAGDRRPGVARTLRRRRGLEHVGEPLASGGRLPRPRGSRAIFFRDWLGTWADYDVATREYIDAGTPWWSR